MKTSIRLFAPLLAVFALAACSTQTNLSQTATPKSNPRPVAKLQLPAIDEPLAPPLDSGTAPKDEPKTPVALAPDEPLIAPIETGAPVRVASGGIEAKGSMWGSAAGESYGAGGLGLTGVGEGGGGTGEGIGLGSVGTLGRGAGTGSGSGFGSGHGRLGGSHKTGPTVRMGATSSGDSGGQWGGGVQTGEWDDNANFREFTRWLSKEQQTGVAKLDLSVRRFVVVRDSAGKPVPSCSVLVQDNNNKKVNLTTTSTGRTLLFPRSEGLRGADLVATANCQDVSVSASFQATAADGIVDIVLPKPRVLPDAPTIDIAFVLDTTGSMSEEINALRGTLENVASALGTVGVRPRVGLVEYKDRGDAYVTRLHQMTTDVTGLQGRISSLSAGGGGDTPEHVNEALRVAVRNLKWKPESVARLVFLIGDAPPHLDYPQDEGYESALKDAAHNGMQIFGIAASGMDDLGQVVFRQLAQYTGGTHMFVLRGGAGPQSTGGGDPKTSCGGTRTDYSSGNLDALILSKVRAAIAAKDADPKRIAGLFTDEKERPCDQRIVMAQ